MNAHDNNGSLREQKITIPTNGGANGFAATQSYAYDSLNRIKSTTETVSSSQTWKQTFIYDRYGNRTFDTTSGATTTLGSCAQVIGNPAANTVNNRFSSSFYQYDAAGNFHEGRARIGKARTELVFRENQKLRTAGEVFSSVSIVSKTPKTIEINKMKCE
jgi:hypothetical protein